MKRGYGIVLGLVLLSFAVQAAAPDTDVVRLLVTWIQAGTLVLAVRVASAGRRAVRTAAAASAAVALIALLSLIFTGSVRESSAAIVTGLLVGVAPMVIAGGLVRDLREAPVVTRETLSGVLAIYMLAGMFFSFVYGLLSEAGDDPFFAEISDPHRADFLYFSYTTLTTTGYGDLTAALDLGRTLAVTEALVGQIYLVTVVALIVSNLRPRRRATDAGATPVEEAGPPRRS